MVQISGKSPLSVIGMHWEATVLGDSEPIRTTFPVLLAIFIGLKSPLIHDGTFSPNHVKPSSIFMQIATDMSKDAFIEFTPPEAL